MEVILNSEIYNKKIIELKIKQGLQRIGLLTWDRRKHAADLNMFLRYQPSPISLAKHTIIRTVKLSSKEVRVRRQNS